MAYSALVSLVLECCSGIMPKAGDLACDDLRQLEQFIKA